MVSTLAFLVTLAILVVVHEWGHYRAALSCGVKVLRFSVGFGHVLWRHQASPTSTEFVLSAIPLGGYVRMLDEREAPVDAADLHQAFNRKRLWQRAWIVSAGPLANLVLAVLLLSAVQWVGIEEPRAVLSAPPAQSVADQAGLGAGDEVKAISSDGETWVDVLSMPDLNWQIVQALIRREALQMRVVPAGAHGERTVALALDQLANELGSRVLEPDAIKRIGVGVPFQEPVLGDIIADGPADRAGLKRGDRVLRVDGVSVADANTIRQRIRGTLRAPGATPMAMQWLVQRGQEVLTIDVQPRVETSGPEPVARVDCNVGQPGAMTLVRRAGFDGVVHALRRTVELSGVALKMMGRMVIGEASIRNLSGPLSIADYAGQSVQQGWVDYLAFLAMVSISLGILNLLPLPMLDGGHLMYYLFEGVTGRPVSDIWLMRLQRAGAVVLLALMLLALSNDVTRLLGLH